jgi:hypothetical protein
MKMKYQEASKIMAENEEHECTCGGACKEKLVKVEEKNQDSKA